MKGYIKMRGKELLAAGVFERLLRREINQVEAGKLLGITDRQVRRKLPAYKLHGVKSLVHGNRGKVSGRKITQETKDKITKIIRDKYHDFKPTFASEKLEENHRYKFSRETIRQIMIDSGLHRPKRKRQVCVHQLRERRHHFGELVQLDGSPHDWFESRAPRCNLTVFVDDATSKPVWLEFNKSESTNSYFKACEAYFKKCGLPLALYSDKHGVFRINNYQGKDFKKPQVGEDEGLTQFGRAMKELGVEMIYAGSAPAKGRVEKLNGTFQDRLVKEMRLRDISSIEEANQYLPEFTKEYANKFGVEPKSRVNMHRPLPNKLDLKKILSKQTIRTLSRILSCQYENTIYQIKTKNTRYLMSKAAVTIREDYNGQITIWYKGRSLDYTTYKKRPKAQVLDSKTLNPKMDEIKRRHLESLANRNKSQKTPWETPIEEMGEQIYV